MIVLLYVGLNYVAVSEGAASLTFVFEEDLHSSESF